MTNPEESYRQYRLGSSLKSGWIKDNTPYHHEDAAEYFRRAIKAHPQNLLAYRWLAFELRHLDRFDEAEKVINDGLQAGDWPEEMDAQFTVNYTTEELRAELWHELGLVYADSSDSQQAARAFEKSIQIAESVGKGPGLLLSKRCRDAVVSGTYDRKQNRISMETIGREKTSGGRAGCSSVLALLFVPTILLGLSVLCFF